MRQRRLLGCIPAIFLLLAFVLIGYESPGKPEWVTVLGVCSLVTGLVLLAVVVIRTGFPVRNRGIFYRGHDEWWDRP